VSCRLHHVGLVNTGGLLQQQLAAVGVAQGFRVGRRDGRGLVVGRVLVQRVHLVGGRREERPAHDRRMQQTGRRGRGVAAQPRQSGRAARLARPTVLVA